MSHIISRYLPIGNFELTRFLGFCTNEKQNPIIISIQCLSGGIGDLPQALVPCLYEYSMIICQNCEASKLKTK